MNDNRGVNPTPIIIAEDVTKIYHSQSVQVRALDSVSLRVNEGEIVAVMGASGSGKTTLLNCLAGLDSIDSGKIIVAGQNLAELSEHAMTNFRAATMGFIFQSFNLLPILTTLENVELPLLIAHDKPSDVRARAETILAQVGLAQRMRHYPSELSGGQRQRVAIARALIHEPAILWADEPTGSLDSDASQEIMNLLRELNQTRGQTIVLVTHAQEIGAQADRMIHMRDGQIISN